MNRYVRHRRYLLTIALLCLGVIAPASYAHSTYEAALLLDFTGGEVRAELQLPLERMSIAFGKPISLRTLGSDRAALTQYLLDRFYAQSPDGRPFETRLVTPPQIETVDSSLYVVARFVLQPQTASSLDSFDIRDDILLDSIPSQITLVSMRSDWSKGIFANNPQLIGVLHGKTRSLTVDRTDRSWLRGFGSIFRLGIRHIAEGNDHLLFLLALLLPAPLLAFRHRWVGVAGVRRSLVRILKVVTAFTVGHSITLALAALGLVSVPGRAVEVLIAGSILVSAIHAIRPLFPGREAGIAAFFGLVHGLAFATTLSALGLGRSERVASILAFNLGIESMQLVAIAGTMPSLLLLSRTRTYPIFRIGGALFAGFASLGWISERLFDIHTSVDMWSTAWPIRRAGLHFRSS